jgi:NADPH:quinone reductase-like Zn-dependent oxidoreductase/short-subunit dehydrogenase/acyl carrier protein
VSGPAAATPSDCVVVRDDVSLALHETQRLLRAPDGNRQRLLLVTRGAQMVSGSCDPEAAASAVLWGFGRVVRNEAPQLRCTCIDLDPLATDDECDTALALERSLDDEDQVAWRQGMRFARRLRPLAADAPPVLAPHVSLTCEAPGDLATLAFTPSTPAQPGVGEVLVRVRAAGINFKDVLHAVGALPMPPGAAFGFDAAGTVDAVGPGVTSVAAGDRVMLTLAPGALATTVAAPAEFVCPLPDSLTFAEGAGLPLPFLTAWHALVHVARLQPGESVLIHAAAGGVGQAAIQVARALGANILATAHPSKHAFLRQQGVTDVFTSRDASFGAGVRQATGGRGADVVLNSLTGPLIEAGLDCTARGGRFVEIGKSGIWSHVDVRARRPDVRYSPFDLADVARESPARIRAMFEEVASRLGGAFAPLRVRAFAATHVVDAFRLLSRARHVGRVVVMMPAGGSGVEGGVQLITGGFGALGQSLARDLVRRGTRRLAIVSRTAPDAGREQWMATLRAEGVDVRAYASTLRRREDADRVLTAVESDFGEPVRGVFHLAGVLADATIAAQTDQSLARVLEAKLTSAWSLHEATRTRELDRFVLFSSAAALLGTPGQANYAAANAGLDALAAVRRAEGLPALSINWGPWGSGMAARLAAADRERMAAAGVLPLEEAGAWQAMHELLSSGCAQAAVIDADWSRVARRLPDASLLRSVQAVAAGAARNAGAGVGVNVVNAVAVVEPAARRGAIARYIESRVAAVLGRPEASEVPHTRGFFSLGMDSLTSLELRNRLEKELGLPLPPTITLEYGSVELLAGYLAARHPAWATPPDAAGQGTANPLGDLSEAELAALLSKELGG